jgi:hypothetical protein
MICTRNAQPRTLKEWLGLSLTISIAASNFVSGAANEVDDVASDAAVVRLSQISQR